ncbi:hypothetical protein CPT03_06010 [Pedobacter ginsengisoli]|uniref:Uncharacterized protein n=1 Tax=Pedobacter ginsengisoli TaxID=363852 RepID=A0A2D1U374_9SPHI|nr:leucine-rich repeat domain-containing protein [Pedobacter ginsengisoli]ATP56043.1 hypothetical protein CPT03_06010 [Pedobacter ginsengisoli]
MNVQRLALSVLLTSALLLFFNIQNIKAQTDSVLFYKYIEKPEYELSFLNKLTNPIPELDYQHINLDGAALRYLNEVIRNHKQANVVSIFFAVNDTINIAKVFSLLQQFPNLEALSFYDNGQNSIKSKYRLPEEILTLSNLKFFSISGAENLDAHDTFDKLHKMPSLRGVDLLEYKQKIPDNSVLPNQITFVMLSTPQLLSLDIEHAVWQMAKIEQKGDIDSKDETLLEKLAKISTLKMLDFKFCYIKDGAVFKKFSKLNSLRINPILAKDAEFIKSLSALTELKELAIYGPFDTSHTFSGLEKLKNLESLSLRWITRFKNHPYELIGIRGLTKLRSLNIQSCDLSGCPDFFKPLVKLESVILRWNTEKWTQNSSFSLPASLYQLPELKTLIIWKTISDMPPLINLPKLQILDLSYNNLQRIPEEIANIKNLKALLVSGNQLKDISKLRWANLTTLESLDLSQNQITQFPEGVQYLHRLKHLFFSRNKITSFPALDMGKYQLKKLSVDNNPLQNLPANIDRYQDLQELSASKCGLESLPNGIGNLKQLEDLYVDGNNLKTLPKGLANNLNLHNLNLNNNSKMDEQSICNVVFANAKKQPLIVNLANTGLKILPADAPWEKLELILDLSNNQLKTLPVEMTKMKWFNITLKNNPLAIDTGFISRGILNAADAKIVFEELGYKPTALKVTNSELVISMSNAVAWLYADSSFKKAVEFAKKAKDLDSANYEKNVYWFAIGMSRYKTKDYKNAITDLNKNLENSIYKTWWHTLGAKQNEAALAESYRILGDKTKAAEIHALFANKNSRTESFLNAALSYMELGELSLSKRYFDSAVSKSRGNYLKYPNLKDIHIYNYAEILIMAEKPDEVLNMFKSEDPKIFKFNLANADYLETIALLMKYPADYKKLKNDYLKKLEKNGKVTDWDYSNFNRWIKYSNRSEKEKQQLSEIEVLNN